MSEELITDLFPDKKPGEAINTLELALALSQRGTDRLKRQNGNPIEAITDLSLAVAAISSRVTTKAAFLQGMADVWDMIEHDPVANPEPLRKPKQ